MKSSVTRPFALTVLASALFLAPLTAYQDGPPYRIGAGVYAPIPILRPAPLYPDEVKAEKIQGSVLLRTVVDEFGIPTEVEVVKSLDPRLDTEAIEALKRWRFKPGMKDDRPVAVKATIEIRFNLL